MLKSQGKLIVSISSVREMYLYFNSDSVKLRLCTCFHPEILSNGKLFPVFITVSLLPGGDGDISVSCLSRLWDLAGPPRMSHGAPWVYSICLSVKWLCGASAARCGLWNPCWRAVCFQEEPETLHCPTLNSWAREVIRFSLILHFYDAFKKKVSVCFWCVLSASLMLAYILVFFF